MKLELYKEPEHEFNGDHKLPIKEYGDINWIFMDSPVLDWPAYEESKRVLREYERATRDRLQATMDALNYGLIRS